MSVTLTAKIEFQGCPTCCRVFSHMRPATRKNRMPIAGTSFIICAKCKVLLIFRTVEPDSFRLPTEVERNEIMNTDDYWTILGRLTK